MKLCTLLSLVLLVLCSAATSVGAQEFYNIELLANVDYTAGNNENGNDIWGYVDDNGIEYAVAGSTAATYIYSLEDPRAPILRARIPGAQSTWRDIKDHEQYLYVVADVGTDGLLVINMENAPDDITWSFYQPDVNVGGAVTRLDRCHNLYISDEGYCVLSGCNVYSGTPLFFDLEANAEEPPFVGASRRTYAHDVYAENGVLYSSDINAGRLTTHDYTEVDNIFELGSVLTTTTFTHNAWPTDNDAAVFTTDEKPGAFVDSYDSSDPTDLQFLDKFRPDDTYESGSIPHNTHVLGDYLATSWYRDGVVLTDATRPHNLVEVGRYDTYPSGGGDGFDGDWGAYPYLPSGTLLVSDIQTGLYVFDPTYEQGCYFEGVTIDTFTRQPVGGVEVDFAGLVAQATTSGISGDFATGIYEEGIYPVTFSREGYVTKQVFARLSRGELVFEEVELMPINIDSVTVEVVDEAGVVIPGAQSAVQIVNTAGGLVNLDVIGGAWGYVTDRVRVAVDPATATTVRVELVEGFYDDFVFDFGWTVSSTASTGTFVREIPIGTDNNGQPVQLGADLGFDFGGEAYVTGNGAGGIGDFDVDNGATSITSPAMDLTGRGDDAINFYYYFYNEGGNTTPDDELTVTLTNGAETIELFVQEETTAADWVKYRSAPINTLIAVTDSMRITFATSDLSGSGHLVEAMIDGFSVSGIDRPEVTFMPETGCAPLGVDVAATGDPGLTYDWQFVGATTQAATGATPFVSYEEPGIYDVVLTASDAQGGSASFTFTNAIEVLPQTEANFRTEVLGLTVDFFNTSIGGQSVVWDFGDGATSTAPFTQHTYAAPGDYTVTISVDGPCGSASFSQVVSVEPSGTDDFTEATGIEVLGNPVATTLQLRNTTAGDVDVMLTNAVGQVVLRRTLAAGVRAEIDVDGLAAGSYFLTSASAGDAKAAVIVVR